MHAGLPAPTAALFGRDQELSVLAGLLVSRRARLVTLTGLGGCGKTRLAIEAGWRGRQHYSDGVSFADLSAVRDARGVGEDLCRQLEIASLPGHSPADRLCEVLADLHRLLVVDNFEQVVDAADVLARLVAECPGVSVLVTSRRRLRLAGERVLPIAPLRVPSDEEEIAQCAAVELYCDRAAAVDPSFARSGTSLTAVAEICRRLDGLPLALELAAARSRSLPPVTLLRALDRAADGPWALLDHPRADAPGGQHSLAAALGWSIDLLAAPELALFRRLGVFRGSWSIEAAEALCLGPAPGTAGAPDTAGLDPIRLLDGLSTLVDLNLVDPVRDTGDAPRYRLLDMIAVAARQLLAQAGEQATLECRHAEHYLRELLAAEAGLESAAEADWFRRIDEEAVDILSALEWLAAQGRLADVVRAAAALGPYWLNRGRFSAGRQWLTVDAEDLDPSDRAVARGWALRLTLDGWADAIVADDARTVIAQLESVREAVDNPDDPRRWLRACEHLSYAHRLYGDVERGWAISMQALARCTLPDLAWWRAEHLLRLSLLAEQRGERDAAQRFARQAMTAADAGGNTRVHARAMQAQLLSGTDMSRAALIARLRTVLALSEEFGDRRGAVTTRIMIAGAAGAAHEPAQSGRAFVRAITESREIGYQHGVGLTVLALIMRVALDGDWTAAATMHGAVVAVMEPLRRQMTHRYSAIYDKLLDEVRATTGSAAFDAVVRNGAQFSWEQLSIFALARARTLAAYPPAGPAAEPAGTDDARAGERRTAAVTATDPREPLSPREREVLVLIARGMTNAQIAQRLFLSPKTVMHHSGHIYQKLDVRGRVEAVAWASRRGLLQDETG